jgi:threonine aldolase
VKTIDLRSDTVTKPTQEMREAMLTAIVGDDVNGEDPSVNRLEELTARILEKEAALFVTSGTQGNQLAILATSYPGDEIIVGDQSHIFYYEAGAAAALAGVQNYTLPSHKGEMDPHHIEKAIREEDIHFPRTSLLCLENTHNRAGGVVLSLEYMKMVAEIARKHHIPVHLDGARLFNAAVALGVDVKEITQHVDTVQICLSKGLCAPVGSVLAGPKVLIDKARIWRKRLGGGMRQAGVIAAPGIVALTTMVGRLAEDHRMAKRLAKGLTRLAGIHVDTENVQTNIVLVDVSGTKYDESGFIERLTQEGILAFPFDTNVIRFVTHRDLTEEDIDEALIRIEQMVSR